MGRSKFTTSGAHGIIAMTLTQKNDLCTEDVGDNLPSHRTRSVYHLEKLDLVVHFLGRKGDS